MHMDAVPPTPLTQSERQTVYRLFTDEHIARPYHTSHHISAEHEKNYHEAHFTVHGLLRTKGACFKPYRLKKIMDRITKIIEVLHQHPDMMPAAMRQIPRRLVMIQVDDTQCQTFTTLELYHWLKKADKKMVKLLYKQALHFEALFSWVI